MVPILGKANNNVTRKRGTEPRNPIQDNNRVMVKNVCLYQGVKLRSRNGRHTQQTDFMELRWTRIRLLKTCI